MKHVLLLFLMIGALLFCALPSMRAQAGPEAGGHELQFWTAGGHGTNGITQHTGVWIAGARYGWILTGPHGPGFLRGKFEFAVDAIPAFVVFQPTNTAYGVGLDPFAMVWNFEKHGRIVPYAELSGGVLFTNTQVPPGSSRVNFTSDGGLGLHFLLGKLNWNADVRFMHISDAGLNAINPGINTVQLRLGIGMFTGGRRQ
ncbi:MAG: acyloxyacyl hydrolase [Acidobacteriia bacterium]|nr:acyloxyacyl hydrolase [Terriglobia bacterium]